MLAETLRAYCKQQHLEQRQLARIIGIGESTLTRLMQGKGVNQETLLKIIVWLLDKPV